MGGSPSASANWRHDSGRYDKIKNGGAYYVHSNDANHGGQLRCWASGRETYYKESNQHQAEDAG